MSADDGLLHIAHFKFCKPHGSEFCNTCHFDFRSPNHLNADGVEQRLREAVPGITDKLLQNRPGIPNAYHFAVESKKRDSNSGGPLYECKKHHVVDCSTCFDWAQVAIDRAKTVWSNQEVPKIEASKEDKVKLLTSMGLDLSSVKLEKTLDRKLETALDLSQDMSTLVDVFPLDPSSLPVWPKDADSVMKAMHRGNLVESFKQEAEGRSSARGRSGNAFIDVRVTLMTLTKGWNDGRDVFILQDESQENAMLLRVINIYTLKDNIPVMALLYQRASSTTPLQESIQWMQAQMNSHSEELDVREIKSSAEEQTLLLAILARNAKRLDETFKPKRDKSEKFFKLSVILPIRPLGQEDFGKLTNHVGCAVCGKTKVPKVCSACHSEEYCGPVCQREHWQEHRPFCNSLQGGRWTIINLTPMCPEMGMAEAAGLKHMVMLSYSGQPKNATIDPDAPPPPNIHGNKPFMIKLQKPGNNEGSIYIYDRTRSFRLYLSRDQDAEGWHLSMSQMHTGPMGSKVFRWAKRVGDFELSVCLDRPPLSNPQW